MIDEVAPKARNKLVQLCDRCAVASRLAYWSEAGTNACACCGKVLNLAYYRKGEAK